MKKMINISDEALVNVNDGSYHENMEIARTLGYPYSVTVKQLVYGLRKFDVHPVFDFYDKPNRYYVYSTRAPLTHAEVMAMIAA